MCFREVFGVGAVPVVIARSGRVTKRVEVCWLKDLETSSQDGAFTP